MCYKQKCKVVSLNLAHPVYIIYIIGLLASARCAVLPTELMWPSGVFCTVGLLGPKLWNSLPRLLRDTGYNTTSFGHSLKTFLSEY